VERKGSYKTKQQERILSFLSGMGGSHITAGEICAFLRSEGTPVGVATVYRQLEKLVEAGLVKKYVIDGVSGACFQYANEREDDGDEHFHLKCEGCGALIHLSCGFMTELGGHIAEEHGFTVNPNRTVLYGRCEDCVSSPQ
jgi:Fur family ferric uptake transcriptional regulator